MTLLRAHTAQRAAPAAGACALPDDEPGPGLWHVVLTRVLPRVIAVVLIVGAALWAGSTHGGVRVVGFVALGLALLVALIVEIVLRGSRAIRRALDE